MVRFNEKTILFCYKIRTGTSVSDVTVVRKQKVKVYFRPIMTTIDEFLNYFECGSKSPSVGSVDKPPTVSGDRDRSSVLLYVQTTRQVG